MRIAFLFSLLTVSVYANGVKSTTGQLRFDVDNDGVPEMILNSSGLGIKNENPSSTLVQPGTLSKGFETLSSNATLSSNSMVFADSSNGDLYLDLPYAGNVTGRVYSIKKTSPRNYLFLSGSGNKIDDTETLILDPGDSHLPSIQVMSNGVQWYVIQPSDFESTIASDNLIAYWDMDNSTGNTLLDGSGDGQDATITGMSDAERSVSGIRGRAIRFNGSANIIVDPPSPDPGHFHDTFYTRTISMWLTIDGGGGGPRIAYEEGGATNGIALAYRTTPDTLCYVVRVNSTSTEITSTSTFAEDDSVWVHVAMVYDHGAMTLYINGTAEATGTRDTEVLAHSDDPGIGALTSASAFVNNETPWDGRIDELRIFNRVLTADEISTIYERDRP